MDTKYTIEAILKASGVRKFIDQFRRADDSMDGMNESTKRTSGSIRRFISATAGIIGVVGLFNMLRNSVSGAVERVDTLNQFPRVMEMMGHSAEDSRSAINQLSDGIEGLPTTLDTVASTTQRIASMTGDLGGAVDTTLALNNAFLASGASTADASRGLEQFIQMLSRGEVDLQGWRSLQETMPVALNQVAEAFGYAGESAQSDLYDALKDGEVTMDEFNAKIVELSNETGGFGDMARESSQGISTSWQNVQTAVVKGMADMLNAIDEGLSGFGGIAGVFDSLKGTVQTVFSTINENLPAFISGVQQAYNNLRPWIPTLLAIGTGILTVVSAIHIFHQTKAMIQAIRVAMIALNGTVWANPWTYVAMAAIAAVLLIINYWEPISQFFADLWEGIKNIFYSAYDYLNNITDGRFSQMVAGMKDYMMMAWDNLKAVWEWIKNSFINVLDFLKALVRGDFEGMKDAIQRQMENSSELIDRIWGNIKGFFDEHLSNIWNTVKNAFRLIVQNGINRMEELRDGFWNILLALVDYAVEGFHNLVDSVKQGMSDAVDAVLNVRQRFLDAGKRIIQSIADGITNGIGKVKDAIGEVTSTIRGFLPFSPAKYGALRDIHKIRISETIADSIANGKRKAKQAMQGVSQAIYGEMPNINIGSEVNRINRRNNQALQNNITSELAVNKQPAYISVSIGGQEFRRFVEDITNEQQFNERVDDMFQ